MQRHYIFTISLIFSIFIFQSCDKENGINKNSRYTIELPVNGEGDKVTKSGDLNIGSFMSENLDGRLNEASFSGTNEDLDLYISLYKFGSGESDYRLLPNSFITMNDSINLADLMPNNVNYNISESREKLSFDVEFNRYFTSGMNTNTSTSTAVSGRINFEITQ